MLKQPFKLWVLLLLLGTSITCAAQGNTRYIGDLQKTVDETYICNAPVFWSVEDMDEGTAFTLEKGLYRLMIVKDNGIIWITSGKEGDDQSRQFVMGQLPIKIPTNSKVRFTCPKTRFVYMVEK